MIWLVIAAVMIATAAFAYDGGAGWLLVNWKVRSDFPTVPRLDTKEVAAWLSDTKRARPVLLDVRTKPEFEVSHLHGAQRIEPDSAADAVNLPRDKPIVTMLGRLSLRRFREEVTRRRLHQRPEHVRLDLRMGE